MTYELYTSLLEYITNTDIHQIYWTNPIDVEQLAKGV